MAIPPVATYRGLRLQDREQLQVGLYHADPRADHRQGRTLPSGLAFIENEELQPIQTPLGSIAFVQAVGITDGELTAARRWTTAGLLGTSRPHLPFLATNLRRQSFHDDPVIAAVLNAGARKEGSSTFFLLGDHLSWSQEKRFLRESAIVVSIGITRVPNLVSLLPLRLGFEEELLRGGAGHSVLFRPGTTRAVEQDGTQLEVTVDGDGVGAFTAALSPVPGRHGTSSLPVVIWEVFDPDGDQKPWSDRLTGGRLDGHHDMLPHWMPRAIFLVAALASWEAASTRRRHGRISFASRTGPPVT